MVHPRASLTGALHELEGDTATMIFAAFYGLDAGWPGAAAAPPGLASIFSPRPDPGRGRRFMARPPAFWQVHARTGGWVKPIVNACWEPLAVPTCPTWISGGDSIFVPFYGVPAMRPVAVAL